ncbi:MAG TPA: ArgE/DapE family deacylase [Caldilineaceae bacterium]|nr:ArgE/DapE family deacylase [Caldilineaceae bacterium]
MDSDLASLDKLHIDEPYLTRTLVDLVQINSANPSLTPGSPGEAAIGDYVAGAMRALGLHVTVHTLGPNRVNVVGIRPGAAAGGRSLMWNAHMDTVSAEGMAAPFSADVRAGRLYGRGSQDMKGSLAAMLAAVKALNEAQVTLAGDLLLTAVADEEYASIGTADIVKRYRADAAIVTEPTDLALCLAHRGFIWFTVETTGRAAHGSRYDEGIDAIMHMGRFLAELDRLEQELRARPPHPLAGPPSLHASIIQGGSELSVYPASCTLQVERRTAPGESVDQATQELQAIIDRLRAADPAVQATVQPFLSRAPFAVAEDAPIVQVLDHALARRLGQAPAHTGAAFWTDAALLAEAGIESVLLGPVGRGLHSAEEWVDLRSVVDLAAVLAAAAIDYCGSNK